jgi:L-ascorbate metabolism protein UlaG (beta-lactamase superfamily)
MHFDHMDPPSIRQIGRDTRIIAPAGTRTFLKRRGFRNVTEIGREEQVYIRGVRIMATEADHSGDRPPFGPKLDSIGFLIEGDYQVYFAGDTDLFPEMSDLGRRNLHTALLPVWGYGPTLGSGHLDPYRAAQSLTFLMPQVAIPIHWGTYGPIGMRWMQMPFMHHPPYAFERHAGIIAPDVQVEILEPGETYSPVSARHDTVESEM